MFPTIVFLPLIPTIFTTNQTNMSSANPLKQASAMDTALDDLGAASKSFSNSSEGKKEEREAARALKQAERQAAIAAAQAAKEEKIAAQAARQECTVKILLSGEALAEAVAAAVGKLSGLGADAIEKVVNNFPKVIQTRIQLTTKEGAAQLSSSIDEDGYVLKGKEATGGLKIISAVTAPVPSRAIFFENPIDMPNRKVPEVQAPAPVEGEEKDEATLLAEKEARDAQRDAAQAQVDTLYNMFKEDVVAKVHELSSAWCSYALHHPCTRQCLAIAEDPSVERVRSNSIAVDTLTDAARYYYY